MPFHILSQSSQEEKAKSSFRYLSKSLGISSGWAHKQEAETERGQAPPLEGEGKQGRDPNDVNQKQVRDNT